MSDRDNSDGSSDGSSDCSLLTIKYKDFIVPWPKDPPGQKAFSVAPYALEGAPEGIKDIFRSIQQDDGPRFLHAIHSKPHDEKDHETTNALCCLIWELESLDMKLDKFHNDFFPKLRSWSASLQANLIPTMEAYTVAEDGAGSTLKQLTEGPEPLVTTKVSAAKLRFFGAIDRADFLHEPDDNTISFIRSDKYDNIQAPKDGVVAYPECPPFSAFSTKGMRDDFTESMYGAADRFLAQGVAVSGSIKAYGARHIEHTKITENVYVAIILALRHLQEFWKILKAPTSFPVKRNKALYNWVYEMQRVLEEVFLLPAKQEKLLWEKKFADLMREESPVTATRKYYHVL
ncbi:MAG: hypothetical protein M1812_004438 [Candelaria pacifica]|nr:MAG: hypothetical protein M1812_004438 [Candelaria pacifica]